ncbi:hypothetical protein VB285_004453 [Salmonella enterica]|nr:hypothetical protein [Salmonella enterica]ELU3766304.1 hypothetical protein [Salmonella enterica]EMC1963995.1 hypothetical protein [Salmonella enterica]
MYSRLKEMEHHYKQLDSHWKNKIDGVFIQLDDLIEDLLLEQEYEGGSNFIRAYRKTNSIKDLKRRARNRVVRINSRLDGIITDINHEAERRKIEVAADYNRRQRISNFRGNK